MRHYLEFFVKREKDLGITCVVVATVVGEVVDDGTVDGVVLILPVIQTVLRVILLQIVDEYLLYSQGTYSRKSKSTIN